MNRTKVPPGEDFHGLMKELLQFMQIKPPSNLPSEVYSFSFDEKTEVNMFMPHPGALDMLVLIGTLNHPKSGTVLEDLLAMNRYVPDGFPLNIGMDPASGKVTLWSRHILEGLDIGKLTSLLTAVLNCAAMAQDYLNGKPPARPATVNHRHTALAFSSKARAGIS